MKKIHKTLHDRVEMGEREIEGEWERGDDEREGVRVKWCGGEKREKSGS